MSSIINLIKILLTVGFSLGAIIIVHELGHFLAARKFGCRVEEFGIGLPPRICGWRKVKGKYKFFWGKKIPNYKDDKDTTCWTLNWIPLGGFCKISGESGVEKESDKLDPKNFNSKPVWQRACIILAGVTMNLVFGVILLILAFWMGSGPLVPGDVNYDYTEKEAQIRVIEVAKDKPAYAGGLKQGDQIIQVDDKKYTSDDKFIEYIQTKPEQDVTFIVKRWFREKELIVTPESTTKRFEYLGEDVEKQNDEDYFLEKGDVILTVDGNSFESKNELISLFLNSPEEENFFILNIQRGNNLYKVKVSENFNVPSENLGEIAYVGIDVYEMEKYHYVWWKVPYYSVVEMGRFLWFLPKEVGVQVSQWLSGETEQMPLTGPVGIAVITGMLMSFGISVMIGLMVNITVALAIFNVLPIPALDGGRVIFLIIEKIKGSPVNPKVEAMIHGIFFILLMGIGVVVMFFDVFRFKEVLIFWQ